MSDQRHTIRFPVPHSIIQGRDTTLTAPVYLSGAVVASDGGSIDIYDASNVLIVDGGAITHPGGVATYTVSAATVAGKPIGAGWRVVWTLTAAAADLAIAENDAALCARQLYCVIADADLFRRVPALDPNDSSPITLATDYQTEIDEAWVEIENRLYEEGRRPEWIRSPSSLRSATLWLTLAIIFEGLETRNVNGFEIPAKTYRDRYMAAYSSITALVDLDGDGDPDDNTRKGVTNPVVWL